jgi:hypothetical protein
MWYLFGYAGFILHAQSILGVSFFSIICVEKVNLELSLILRKGMISHTIRINFSSSWDIVLSEAGLPVNFA